MIPRNANGVLAGLEPEVAGFVASRRNIDISVNDVINFKNTIVEFPALREFDAKFVNRDDEFVPTGVGDVDVVLDPSLTA